MATGPEGEKGAPLKFNLSKRDPRPGTHKTRGGFRKKFNGFIPKEPQRRGKITLRKEAINEHGERAMSGIARTCQIRPRPRNLAGYSIWKKAVRNLTGRRKHGRKAL